MADELERIPRMIATAIAALNKATTAAEILDAKDQATAAYTAAKLTARFAKVKDAHDTILATCHKMQADALMIEARAQCRLADEYDAAQERGEIRNKGGDYTSKVRKENLAPTADDIGLTRKQVHQARQIRDAEKAKPGVLRKALDAKLEAGEEPTRADVKRAISNKSKLQPARRKNTSLDAKSAAEAILDQGKSYVEVEKESGLTNTVLRSAVAREEGRREAEPHITPDMLSMTAQQKLDTAIRQHKHKLDQAFYTAVNARVKEWLEETILPKHRKEQAEAKAIMNRRIGIMDKATFNKIRRGLHPDSRLSISDKMLGEAFDAFMGLEKKLLNEKDSPTNFQEIPKTMAEWDKMRATKTKRATNRTVRPR